MQKPKINIWTKILVVDSQQVLVYKEYDADDEGYDPYKLKTMSQHNGGTFMLTMSFTTELARDYSFDKYDSGNALRHIESATNTFKEIDPNITAEE